MSTQNSSKNIAIGHDTLDSFVGGGVPATNGNNTVLGSYACRTLQTGGNNTVIGQAAEPSSANVSNEITLGHTSVNHFRVPGIGVSFSEGGGVVTGIMSASSFKLLDGSDVGGVSSDSQENTLAGTNAGDAIQNNGERNCFFGFDAGTDLTLSLIHI